MACQVLNFTDYWNGNFRHMLEAMRGERIRVVLRKPREAEFEITGVNTGHSLIDGSGREFCYHEYCVEDLL